MKKTNKGKKYKVVPKASIEYACKLVSEGSSIRQAEAETGVHRTTIAQNLKRAKINKTAVKKLIEEKTIIEAKLKAMPPAVAEKINAEVDANLEAMEFYKNSARTVAKIAIMSLETNPEPSAADAKTTMETLKTGMVVEGVVPYYPNAATFNNTNAQQNIDDSPIGRIELVALQPTKEYSSDDL